ncbi:MAG TPA: metal-dependent transcriptional regulator [Spirochaetia bacterium]|nr:metal-dependent transcriptional regulator [Spirochaetia bacterium]
MASESALSESQEDYLEAIYHIVKKKHAARAKDISRRLGVNNSSVTGALRALSQKGLVNYEPYDLITLTSEGDEIAGRVVKRHEFLLDFLVRVLGIPADEAEVSACHLEHSLTDIVFERLIQFVDTVTDKNGDSVVWKEPAGFTRADRRTGEGR